MEQKSSLGEEQAYLDALYRRLDGMRAEAAARLAEKMRESGGTPQERSQRDSAVTMYTDQVAVLGAVENGLCFGRLDFAGEAERRYIGRIGVFDDRGDYEPLLVDWRAPAARPFYLATAAAPLGVVRRRHIRTAGRTVAALDDEVLDLDDAGAGAHDLTGEATLLAALDARRTGRMRDIVETIQAEQDRIIRADLSGTLVVQGGPGTGKTAVALHRAAYLLYTYRQQLSKQVVLILGPNPTFLGYIGQVLPSLAETGVLLRTLGGMFPGVNARRAEPDEVAEIKGRAVMADVIAAAVADRQRVPDEPIEINIEGETQLLLQPATVRAARDQVRRTGKLHNLARPDFDTEIIHALSLQLAEKIGTDPYANDALGGEDAPGDPIIFDEADLAQIRRELRREPEVLAVLDWLWPVLTPQQIVAGLYASLTRMTAAASGLLTLAEQEALLREPKGGFSPADVPLLDEAAELLGEEENTRRERVAELERLFQLEYAQGAIDIALGSRSVDLEDEDDPELLMGTDLLDASRMAERQQFDAALTAAQRAAADRTWAFGHVIVDEAQELSPMAWRLLMRRCPSRSMTVVGDVAQTGDLGGTSSWDDALAPYLERRYRLTELTVSYRTPGEIMDLAAPVLARVNPALAVPRAVRHTGVRPWRLTGDLSMLVKAVSEWSGDGRLGVIVPAGLLGAATAALPEAASGARADLTSPVVVLTVRQSKGLEFDAVIVYDPDRIVAESPRGDGDLYVALTRATQTLGLVSPGPIASLPD
ncbi:HelD family protein [Catenuloplanes indicus]|uniref:DNA helicase IV n=1 Tax=Catenuloplanes indicus TaxID=137267 RepID=A0AAE3W677_9ACTN|nr:ATP-binding domain-containing protein [Catenuloplanes indicus]MDQ0370341.1 DNA helicase IV [Catenuloplanes indicus]